MIKDNRPETNNTTGAVVGVYTEPKVENPITLEKSKNKDYLIKPGQVLNPKGRGHALNKFTQIKIDICSWFKLKDFKVWADKHPSEAYKLMAQLLPKDIKLEGDAGEGFKIILIKSDAGDSPKEISG